MKDSGSKKPSAISTTKSERGVQGIAQRGKHHGPWFHKPRQKSQLKPSLGMGGKPSNTGEPKKKMRVAKKEKRQPPQMSRNPGNKKKNDGGFKKKEKGNRVKKKGEGMTKHLEIKKTTGTQENYGTLKNHSTKERFEKTP